jgi:hypothetical protein
MKRIGKRGLGALAAVSALALVAMPGLASAHGAGQAGGTMQPAHMTQGQSGAGSGQPCPMGTGYRGMMGHGTGHGMMGPGMMGPGMMGQGMMGRGIMGPGMMDPGMKGPGFDRDRGHGMRVVPRADLSTDDVRHFFEDRLAMHGNKRLKVGEVTEADDDTILADIVTLEDSLVQRFKVDRHTGRMQRTE